MSKYDELIELVSKKLREVLDSTNGETPIVELAKANGYCNALRWVRQQIRAIEESEVNEHADILSDTQSGLDPVTIGAVSGLRRGVE